MTNSIVSNNEEMLKRLEVFKQSLADKGEVCVIGHDNIDVDATLSGVLLVKLLSFLGIPAKFTILQSIKKNYTYGILNDLTDIKMHDYSDLTENDLRNLFLVDHYETIHKGKVIGCIDHHPTETKNDYAFSYVRNSSATAYLIYELMQAANYPITSEDAKLIVIAMLVDTTAFRSSKTIPEEVEIAKALAREFDLDYDYLEKYCLCLTPIEKMSTQQITSNGQKKYNYNGHKVESAYLQLYGMPSEAILNSWLTYLRNKVTNETCDTEMSVFIIFELEANITYEYQITPDHTKKIVHRGILSRGKNVMPKIEKKYCASITSEEQVETIVKKFSESLDTIATMESCTGGALASAITNVSGASNILSESYVSYSNESKIKFGVPSEIIEAHTVYSSETAKAMANAVKKLANVTVGIGITGQIGRSDPSNPGIKANRAWYAIISSEKEFSAEIIFHVENSPRADKKAIITGEIINDLYLW